MVEDGADESGRGGRWYTKIRRKRNAEEKK